MPSFTWLTPRHKDVTEDETCLHATHDVSSNLHSHICMGQAILSFLFPIQLHLLRETLNGPYISYRGLMHRQPGLDQEHQTSSIPNSNSLVSSEKMPIFLTLISWILWLISPYYDILELLRILMLHSSKIWKVCCQTGWGVIIVNVIHGCSWKSKLGSNMDHCL